MRISTYCNSIARQGSALITALIFAVALGVMVTSILKLATGESELADESFLRNTLVNLNEAGAEEALWSVNKQDWTGWDDLGTYRGRLITGLNLGNGNQGTVHVLVENFNIMPIVYTKAAIGLIASGLTLGGSVSKQVRMELANRTLFANGLTAKETLTINGGSAIVDSYQSSAGPPDPLLNRRDKGTVATVSIEFEDLDAGNSEIYGYVATGGGAPAFGPNAKVYSEDWAPGDPLVDPSRVTTDFTAEFPDIDPPCFVTDREGRYRSRYRLSDR